MQGVHPSIYRWRWLWMGLWLFGLLIGLSCLIAPVRWLAHLWPPHDWIRLVEFYYNDRFRVLNPWSGLSGVFSIELGRRSSASHFAALVFVVTCYVVLTVIVLWPGRRLDALPAKRPVRWWQRVTVSLVQALLLAAVNWELCTQYDPLNRVVNAVFFSSRGSRAVWYDNPWMLALPLLVGFGAGCYAAVRWFDRSTDRYWRLERLIFWTTLGGAALWIGSHVVMRLTDRWLVTGTVVGYFVMLWGFGVRTLLLFMLRRYERARARQNDLVCFACGYDLRGSVAAGSTMCPECGAPIRTFSGSSEAAPS